MSPWWYQSMSQPPTGHIFPTAIRLLLEVSRKADSSAAQFWDLALCVHSTSCLSGSADHFQNLHFYLRRWKQNGCLSWLQMSISRSQEVQSRRQLLSNQHFNIMVLLIFYHGWSTDQEPVVIGALEAIKMDSPFPGDRGLEIVARCSLLVNRLLEGRIIQHCKTAKDFFLQ